MNPKKTGSRRAISVNTDILEHWGNDIEGMAAHPLITTALAYWILLTLALSGIMF